MRDLVVSEDYGASRPLGMTRYKVIEAHRLLRHVTPGEHEDRRLRLGGRQRSELLEELQRRGGDAWTVPEHFLLRFCGMEVVVDRHLPKIAGLRCCYAESPVARVTIWCAEDADPH